MSNGQVNLDLSPSYSELNSWYQRPAGQLLAKSVSQHLSAMWADQFGYYFVDLCSSVWPVELEMPNQVRFCIRANVPELQEPSNLLTRTWSLPFKSNSIDGLLLAHVLDYSAFPHEVLREMERVLIADGRVYIVGFSPYWLRSWWRFLGQRSQTPNNARFLSPGRVEDWLAVLGFEVERLVWINPTETSGSSRFGRFTTRVKAPLYLMQAINRRMPVTPIRHRHKLRGISPKAVLERHLHN